MRLIGFGELTTEYYLKNGILESLNGGTTIANIIANLAISYDTAFFGCYGNDSIAKIAVNSLKKLNVDISNLSILNREGKKIFYDNGYSFNCPYCDRLIMYETNVDKDKVINNIKESDEIVIDNLSEDTVEILGKIENKAYLCLNNLSTVKYYSLDELESILNNRFDLIIFSEQVYDYIKKKFSIDSIDFYNLFHPRMLIIARLTRGCDIIVDGELFKKECNDIKVIDLNGCFEAFSASIISSLINTLELDEKNISYIYMEAQKRLIKVGNNFGGISHLVPNYNLKTYQECICRHIELKENIDI